LANGPPSAKFASPWLKPLVTPLFRSCAMQVVHIVMHTLSWAVDWTVFVRITQSRPLIVAWRFAIYERSSNRVYLVEWGKLYYRYYAEGRGRRFAQAALLAGIAKTTTGKACNERKTLGQLGLVCV